LWWILGRFRVRSDEEEFSVDGLAFYETCVDRGLDSVLKVFEGHSLETFLPKYAIADSTMLSHTNQQFAVDLRRRRYSYGSEYVNHIRFKISDVRMGLKQVIRRNLQIVPLGGGEDDRELVNVCLFSIEVTGKAIAIQVRGAGLRVVALIPLLSPFNCVWCKVVPAFEHANELQISDKKSFFSVIVGTGHLKPWVRNKLAFTVAVDKYDTGGEAASDHHVREVVLEPGGGGACDEVEPGVENLLLTPHDRAT